MIITRRNLLLSATGTAVMGRSATFSRKARAATSSGGRDAVAFNKTWLTNPGLPGAPAGIGTKGVLALNWRSVSAPPVNASATFIQTNGGNGNLFFVGLSNSNGIVQMQAAFWGPNFGSDYIYFFGPSITTMNGSWNHDVLSWDLSVPTLKWLSNGNPVTPTIANKSGGNWAVDYTKQWAVGAAGLSGRTVIAPFIGDVADLTLWATGSIDPTDPAVLSKFWDSAGESPIRLGPTAWGTLDASGGLRPLICLSGPPSQFLQNLTAGEFEVWGLAPNYYDTTPTSMFTLSAGSLEKAASDPWDDPA